MIAFFFLIGILGTIKNIDTVSFKPYLHSMQQEGMTQTEDKIGRASCRERV